MLARVVSLEMVSCVRILMNVLHLLVLLMPFVSTTMELSLVPVMLDTKETVSLVLMRTNVMAPTRVVPTPTASIRMEVSLVNARTDSSAMLSPDAQMKTNVEMATTVTPMPLAPIQMAVSLVLATLVTLVTA